MLISMEELDKRGAPPNRGVSPRRRSGTAAVIEGEWRQRNIGRLLNVAIVQFESQVLTLLAADGFEGVRLAHVNVTRNLDIAGTRLTELAARAQMTKQSMGELVDQCVVMDLVRRKPDPQDGRAKILCFTEHGLDFLERFRIAVATTQREMGERLGQDRLQILLDLLWEYTHPEA
jgi:DNA-binding MarR family transcriptional regulator